MSRIQFRITGGQVRPVIAMPISATILELKERIQLFIDVDVARQTLKFNNQELSNDQTINHYRFRDFVTLVLHVKPLANNPKFDILVKSCNEQSKLIRVKETTMVGDLKRKIERHFGIPTEIMYLYRLSEELKDEFPLSAYYVCEGSQVEVAIIIQPR